MTIPDSTDILLSSIVTVGGSGFDAGVLPGSIAVILVAAWMMKGAPSNERTQKGFDLAWILIGAFLLWGLFGCAPARAGDAPAAPAPTAAVQSEDGGRPWGDFDWRGRDVTPLALLIGLAFLFSGGPGGGAKKAVPFLLLAMTAGAAHAAPTPDGAAGDPPGAFNFVCALVAFFGSMASLKAAGDRGGPFFAVLCLLIAVGSGVVAVRNIPPAGAGLIGNVLESDGSRAIKEAKADRIRAENEIARLRAALDAERQRAMMRAAGHAPPSAPAETETDRFVALLVFAVAVGAVGLYWMELRKREAKEAEIRELQVQLAIAERRAADRPLLPQSGALSLADGQNAGGSRCG